MSDLKALLERVEAATGPSCQLEQDIHDHLFPPSRSGDVFDDGTPVPVGWGGNLGPAYTASLEAALALVERVLPGWEWSVRGGPETGDTEAWAKATVTSLSWPAKRHYRAEGPTHALALLAALLRALTPQQADRD